MTNLEELMVTLDAELQRQEADAAEEPGPRQLKQLSCRVGLRTIAVLDLLAPKLGYSRTSLAEELVEAAAADLFSTFGQRLGLTQRDVMEAWEELGEAKGGEG